LPAGLSPEAIKHRTFEVLHGLVGESAARRPLVLALEDLHWVDPTTAEYLTFLLDHLAGARVLLVCTYRPDFASLWSRKSYHSVITLQPLGLPESYQVLTAVLGSPHIQDELATLVLAKTEGVPFFLEELVKSLRETGAIEEHAGQWRLKPRGIAIPVSDTVEEVLTARSESSPPTVPPSPTPNSSTHEGFRRRRCMYSSTPSRRRQPIAVC
jgi:predicted ATPase